MHYYAYLVLVMNEVEKIRVMGVAYAVMLYYEFFFPRSISSIFVQF